MLLPFIPDLENMIQSSVLHSAVINDIHLHVETARNSEATRKGGVIKGQRTMDCLIVQIKCS